MSKDPTELIRIANKSYGNLLSDGFSLFVKSWKKIVMPIGILYIISTILRLLILVDLQWNLYVLELSVSSLLDADPSSLTSEDLNLIMNYLFSSFGLGVLDLMIGNVFTVLALCFVASFLLKYYYYQDANFLEEVRGAFNKKIVPIMLLLGIVIPLGIITLFIVSIIIFGFYIFSIYTYRLDDIEKPLKNAKLYSKGTFWRVIGAFIISYFITLIINSLFQLLLDLIWPVDTLTRISWYDPSSRRLDLLILYSMTQNLVLILLEPLFICLLTPVFASVRANRLLGSRMRGGSPLNYSPKTNLPGALQEPQFSDKGIYCPFCGMFMEFKLNFCPNCGEKLNFK